jgi:hypothetical protein
MLLAMFEMKSMVEMINQMNYLELEFSLNLEHSHKLMVLVVFLKADSLEQQPNP